MDAKRKTWILAAVVMTVACAKKIPQQDVQATAPNAQPAAPLAAQQDPNDKKHGSRKMKGVDVPVYVDGTQRAVLRYGDLPAITNVRDEDAPAFRLTDYLRAIGTAPESVKAVYVFDQSNRIASIEGKELLADAERFIFEFQGGTSGNALVQWDTTGLKNSFLVHEIRRLAVYVGKAAPSLDMKHHCVLGTDGNCLVDGVPGASDPAKGTRIYVDGRMVGVVKRRQLADSTIVGKTDDGDYDFSLTKLVATFGASADGAKSVSFVSGDDVVGRADAGVWAAHEGDAHFTLGKHQHGKIRVHVPADMQAKDGALAADKDALVTSVQLFVHASAPERDVVAITETTDLSAQLASASTQIGDHHGDGDNAGGADEDLGKR